MDTQIIKIIQFTGGRVKWCIWLGKLITRYEMKEYDNLLTSNKKNPEDGSDETSQNRPF